MSDGTYRGRWMDEVFRTSAVSAEVQVFLLHLAIRHMSADGRVSEPRASLAEGLGVAERRITDRLKEAVRVGLLERVARGQKGRTAVYRAAIPGMPPSAQATQGADWLPPESLQGAGYQPAEQKSQGAKNPPAESAQGAVRQPAEPPSGGGLSAPHIYAPTEVSEDAREAVVVPLFGEIKTPEESLSASEASGPQPDRFEEFWKTYPRRIGKAAARKAWDKAIKAGADPERIIWAARAYATLPRDPADGLKYVAHPTTWLNQGRWEDEVPTPGQQVEHRPAPAASRRQQELNERQAQFARQMARAQARSAHQ